MSTHQQVDQAVASGPVRCEGVRPPVAVYAFAATFILLPLALGELGPAPVGIWIALTAAMGWGYRWAWGVLFGVQAISLCFTLVGLAGGASFAAVALVVLALVSLALLLSPRMGRYLDHREGARPPWG